MVKDKWNVIIRTFCGRNHLLTEALYSLIAQGYPNLELIICYDVRSEEDYLVTKSIVDRFKEYYTVREFKYEHTPVFTRSVMVNDALTAADGEFVSMLDDDDIYYPAFGQLMIQQLRANPEANFAYGDYITSNVRKYPDFYYHENKYTETLGEFNKIKFLLDNYILIQCCVFRNGLIGANRFDPKLDLMEDWDFMISLVTKPEFKPLYVNEPVTEYRRFSDHSNTGFIPKNEEEWAKIRQEIRQKRVFNNPAVTISDHDLEIFAPHYDHLISRDSNFRQEEKGLAYRIVKKWHRFLNIDNKLTGFYKQIRNK